MTITATTTANNNNDNNNNNNNSTILSQNGVIPYPKEAKFVLNKNFNNKRIKFKLFVAQQKETPQTVNFLFYLDLNFEFIIVFCLIFFIFYNIAAERV